MTVVTEPNLTARGFGIRLRELRTAADITLAQLGDRAGMAESAIARLERGEREPSLGTLLRLAEALQVKLDDLRPVQFDSPVEPEPPRPMGKRK